MKSPIIKIAMLLFCIILSVTAKAQIVTTNPLEYVALAEGNELILGKVKDQMDGQKKTALLQNTIAAEFEQMRQWEKKYNSYLKTASGFASSLKACTHLYNDGVRIFISLCKLKKAISDNPQGIVAAMSMNNLYIETATELVTVFSLLRDAVAKGGKENMLTGAERSQTLWALNDQLSAFQKKLNLLYLSIRTYTMTDVWNNVTAGMLDRNGNEQVAQGSNGKIKRWRKEKMRRAIFIIITLLCIGVKVYAQIDPTLAGMVLIYTEKSKKTLKNQEKIMLLQTTGHIWTKEEVEAVTNLQREFNDYLDSFRSVISYAAQIYGFYHEITHLTENMGEFTGQLKKSPANAVAVALSTNRNKIYRELIYNSVEIVNDIRTVCLSDNKMTEKQRMEIVFGIRPKLQLMNKKLRRLTMAVKYTSMGDVWAEITEREQPKANKAEIARSAMKRWKRSGKAGAF